MKTRVPHVTRYYPLLLLLTLTACAKSSAVAVEVQTDSAADFSAALILRLPACRRFANPPSPAGLWNDLTLPAARIAVLGYDAGPGRWRAPFVELSDAAPSRNRPPLEEQTRARLDRFLRDVRKNEAVLRAEPSLRPTVIAAHATRALAVDIVARGRVKVAFVFLGARAPGLTAYCADAVRDLVSLLGPDGDALIWQHDAHESSMMACGPAAKRLTDAPGRADVIAVLSDPKP